MSIQVEAVPSRTLVKVLTRNRPLGFARWWSVLRDHALSVQLAVCAELLAELRRRGVPLSTTENRRLLRWEALLFGYLALRGHMNGEEILAEEARGRCEIVLRRLVDQKGLRQLRIACTILDAGVPVEQRDRLLASFLHEAEREVRAVSTASILSEFLEEENSHVRRQALVALARLRQFRCIWRAVRHPDLQTRRDAVSLLHEAGIALDAEELIRQLEDPADDWLVRSKVVALLGRNKKDPNVANALRQALWDKTHPFVRVAAVHALAASQGRHARDAIVPLKDDPAEAVRSAAARELALLNQ